MQPIAVRPVTDGRFEIVAGERRWRALLAERGQPPPAPSWPMCARWTRSSATSTRFIENLSRQHIAPMEEAGTFERVLDTGMTEEQLARKLGIQRVRPTIVVPMPRASISGGDPVPAVSRSADGPTGDLD